MLEMDFAKHFSSFLREEEEEVKEEVMEKQFDKISVFLSLGLNFHIEKKILHYFVQH